jgi:chemotaxis signal transduction protein
VSTERQSINWQEVKQRLHESQQALEKAMQVHPERLQEEYRRRAEELAQRGRQGSDSARGLRVLVFWLGNERLAFVFSDVAELLPFSLCTPVPGGPPQLLGVTNIHGEIRSVVDLGRLLELPEGDSSTSGYVLLLRQQGRLAALRVDRLDNIQSLAPGELAVPAEGEAGALFRFLRGWTPDRLRVLNTQAVLAHPIFQRGSEE